MQLNGKKLKLKGVCEHHDLGALGAAFNKAALKRRLTILKEMGVNAIRTAHNGSNDEIPLRKIELSSSLGQVFHEFRREMKVEAKLYPTNTSYQELEWSVVNSSGIASSIGKVEAFG